MFGASDENLAFQPGSSISAAALSVLSQALRLTASSEAGSCPILYSWDPELRDWLRHGKIIHSAESMGNKTSETTSFKGFVGNFKIAEEEIEVATIDAVTLELDLHDGLKRLLVSDHRALVKIDDLFVELFANDEIIVNFSLPQDLKPADVTKSNLTITGYYDRYPSLLVGRQIVTSSGRPAP